MQPEIVTAAADLSVVNAAQMMDDRGVRHLMVDGPDGGIVSIRAVLRSMLG